MTRPAWTNWDCWFPPWMVRDADEYILLAKIEALREARDNPKDGGSVE